ncbi:MAG: hypothetical protein AAFR81_11875 [Chloroflexota bacterium]
MTDSFYYDDDPPQVWLDDLHDMNIPGLWNIQLTNAQRINLIARVKNDLNEWRKHLRSDIDIMKGRFGHDKMDEMERIVTPYQLLDTLAGDLSKQVRELEDRAKKGKAIPEGFMFGDRIFGDMKTKRWHLGSRADEDRWDDFMSVERRYQMIGKEYQQQGRVVKNAAQRVKEQQVENKRIMAELNKRRSTTLMALQVSFALLAAIITGIIAGMSFLTDTVFVEGVSGEAFGALMLVVTIAAVGTAVVLVRRRQTAIKQLSQDITDGRIMAKRLKEAYDTEKRNFFPTQQTFKEISQEYKQLKASFG